MRLSWQAFCWEYDARGRLISESKTITGAEPFVTEWAYNSADLPVSMTYPGGETVSYGYNARMLLETLGSYVSGTTYDAAGRMTQRAYGNGTQTEYAYFPWTEQGGRLQQIVSRRTVSQAIFQDLAYSYDEAGNITSIVDAQAGPQTQGFSYDALNRLVSANASGGGSGQYNEAYAYNALTGNLASKAGAAYTYDVAHPHAVAALNGNSYGYDANGNQTTRTIDGVTAALGYDAEGHLVSVNAASIPPTSTPGPSPTPVASATLSATATPTPTATHTPTATPTTVPDLLFADGFESGNTSAWSTVVSDGGDLSVLTGAARSGTYGLQALIDDTTAVYVRKNFSSENHLTARVYLDPNSVTIPAGQSFSILQLADDTSVTVRVQLNNSSGTYRLVMDAQNDAQAWVAGQYLAIGDDWQMVEVEWQTASAAGAGDGYVKLWINDVLVDTLSGLDNDTRHVTKASIGAVAGLDAGTAGTVYWDGFEARRGSHIGPLSFAPGRKSLAAPLRVSLAASFVYDGDGKRVAQTINGVTTYFVGNYYEVTGSTVTKYYYAGSQGVAMRTGSTVYYLLTDHLGSTSLTTDESGSVMSELRYTAWGSVRYQAGGTPTEYTYTGQYSDSYINLLDYGSRRYDPETGRFISADTIVPLASQGVQAWDRYAYVSNDPVRYNDPTGHCPTCLIGAGVGALVGGIAYGAYAAYTGNFNGWHLAAAIGGGALAGALIGSAVGAPAAAEVAATTAATVTGGGAAVLEATGGDPSDEIRVLEQTVQGTGQVVNDLIARSELIEKASNELVYQSPGGLNGAREVFNSLSGNVNEIVAKGGTILNKTLDSGGQVLFRTWSSVTRNLPSTPVLQFKDIPGFETLLKFHFPE